MDFSYNKLISLKPQKEKRLFTFLVALATAALFFIPYIIMDGGYFVFYGDYNAQQIPFYQLAHEAIKSGNTGWSWYTDLGANFIGSYSFYLLGSPFFWITLLFPNSFVPYLLAPLLILKFALAALTAYLYIRRFVKNPMFACLGGLLYAFSGFSVYNIFFNHFHEPLVFFPLLLLSLELLITENRRGVFALCVALCAIANYFFFFGMVVFCILYFFVRLFSKAIKITFSRFLVLVFEAVLGLLMSAILLLPSIAAITSNTRLSDVLLGWSAITYGKEQIYLNVLQCFFFPPDIPARPVFFPEADVKWSSLGGWLPLFSMIGVMGWCTNKKGHWLKRIICVCLFMSMVPILNSAFYAFNSAYYARWFYMPILMMSLASVMLFEDSSLDKKSGFRWTAAITLVFALVIGFFPRKNSEGEILYGIYTNSESAMYTARFWIAVAIAVISLVIALLLLKLLKKNSTAFLNSAVACVCIISVIYGNVYIFTGRQHSHKIDEVVIDRLIEGELDLEDDSNYRIDVYDGMDNTAMYLGYPSINAFHSVVPGSLMEFYGSIGIERDVASRPDTDMAGLRNLLSVKYLINSTTDDSFIDENGETLMAGYKYLDTRDGYYIYENQNYIPYGFSYEYFMDSETFDSYDDDTKTRMMLKALVLTDEQIAKYDGILTDLSDLWRVDYEAKEETLTDLTDTEAESDIPLTEDSSQDTALEEIIPEEPEDEGITLATTDEEMSKDSERLRKTSAYEFSSDAKGFTAKVKRDKANLVFFSVPFEEGWTAKVNGKDAQIEKVMNGFMAVKVDEGDSTIRFDYETPYFDLGIEITLGALLIFLIYFIGSSVYLKKKPTENSYPEGDELLYKWHKDELIDAAQEFMLNDEAEGEIPLKPDILDDIPPMDIASKPTKKGFEGGFNIDLSVFDEEEKS